MIHRYSSLLRCIVGALTCAPFAVSALTWEPTNRHPAALPPSAVFATAEAYWIGGRGFVASSPDGENWTTEFADPSEEILAITDWNGSIVIGTRSGKIYYRADGESTWSEASLSRFVYESVRADDGRGFRGVLSDVPKPVNSLKNSVLEFERSEDQIVALTADSVAVTTDLESWTELNELPEGVELKPTIYNGDRSRFYAPPDHIAFGNGVFALIGLGGRSLWTSIDGVTWERSETDLPQSGLNFDGQIYFQDGQWFAAARNGLLFSLLRSTDLVTWEEIRLSNIKNCFGFAAQPGKSLVWGEREDYSPVLYSSNDGIDWHEASPQAGFRFSYVDIVDGPAGLLALEIRYLQENDLLGGRLRSADGTTWTELAPNPERFRSPVEYHSTGNAGGWLFYSTPGVGIFASPNGQNWTPVWPTGESGGGTAELESVAYLENAGKWIVLTTEGQILASTDGISWAAVPIQVSGVTEAPQLFDVVAFGDAFFAISRSPEGVGTLVSSANGANWTSIDGPSPIFSVSQLLGSSAGILLFTPKIPTEWVIGESGSFSSAKTQPDWYSTDGLTWEPVETDLGELPDIGDEVLGDAFALGGDFAMVTRRGKVRLWSPDEGLRVVRPRTSNRFLYPRTITMTDIGNYVVLADNEELATGPGLQWLSVIPSSFEGGLDSVGVVDNRIIALTLDAAYYPILDAENHWTFMGQRFGDWVDTLWFGWFREQQFPWVYHNNHGWNYQVFGEGEALWNWDLSLGTWTWTNPDAYPWIYLQSGEHAGWAYFERPSQTPHRRFFVHASQKWVAEADFQ